MAASSATPQKGFRVWLPMLFALVLIGGMVLGYKLHNTLRNKRDIETAVLRSDRLEALIDLINERYVDSVNANQLYTDAIAGILSHLDPHTTYIPAEELQQENEELEGKFYGIGVEFSIYRDTIYIANVLDNGPAAKVGVAIGDRIIKVGDTLVAGVGITNDRIIAMLKGKQYSPVSIKLYQALTNNLKSVTITRDEVPLNSLDASFMLDKNIGYIKLNRFSATTHKEVVKAIEKLKNNGIDKLVLDLRGNPGGFLESATKIADEFLSGEKLLVYTQGLRSERKEQITTSHGLMEQERLVVIIDEHSASASEILAGAIQDWDRGVLVGRQSYGKGLVQQQFDLPDGSAIRLTTARYYTPSGRGIQRPFDKGKQAYYHSYVQRLQAGWTGEYDTTISLADTTKYYTAAKRIVYAKGGITPDVVVVPDTGKITQQVLDIIYSGAFKNAVSNYFLQHRNVLRAWKSIYLFDKNFKEQELILKSYEQELSNEDKRAYQSTLANNIQRNYLALQAKAQLAQMLFGENGYYYMLTADDKLLHKAVEIINSEQYNSLIRR